LASGMNVQQSALNIRKYAKKKTGPPTQKRSGGRSPSLIMAWVQAEVNRQAGRSKRARYRFVVVVNRHVGRR